MDSGSAASRPRPGKTNVVRSSSWSGAGMGGLGRDSRRLAGARRGWGWALSPAEHAPPAISQRTLALLRNYCRHGRTRDMALEQPGLVVEPLQRGEFLLAPELRAA